MSVDFEWDGEKAAANLLKHRLSFEAGTRVFFDPFVLSEPTHYVDGEQRWRAIGLADGLVLLFVAHTSTFLGDGTELVRIISVRRVTGSERREYEEQYR